MQRLFMLISVDVCSRRLDSTTEEWDDHHEQENQEPDVAASVQCKLGGNRPINIGGHQSIDENLY